MSQHERNQSHVVPVAVAESIADCEAKELFSQSEGHSTWKGFFSQWCGCHGQRSGRTEDNELTGSQSQGGDTSTDGSSSECPIVEVEAVLDYPRISGDASASSGGSGAGSGNGSGKPTRSARRASVDDEAVGQAEAQAVSNAVEAAVEAARLQGMQDGFLKRHEEREAQFLAKQQLNEEKQAKREKAHDDATTRFLQDQKLAAEEQEAWKKAKQQEEESNTLKQQKMEEEEEQLAWRKEEVEERRQKDEAYFQQRKHAEAEHLAWQKEEIERQRHDLSKARQRWAEEAQEARASQECTLRAQSPTSTSIRTGAPTGVPSYLSTLHRNGQLGTPSSGGGGASRHIPGPTGVYRQSIGQVTSRNLGPFGSSEKDEAMDQLGDSPQLSNASQGDPLPKLDTKELAFKERLYE